jgi:hypothetical protein
MVEPPDLLYGYQRRSNYQGQEIALSKHFKRGAPERPARHANHAELEQPSLFSIEEALSNGQVTSAAPAS